MLIVDDDYDDESVNDCKGIDQEQRRIATIVACVGQVDEGNVQVDIDVRKGDEMATCPCAKFGQVTIL